MEQNHTIARDLERLRVPRDSINHFHSFFKGGQHRNRGGMEFPEGGNTEWKQRRDGFLLAQVSQQLTCENSNPHRKSKKRIDSKIERPMLLDTAIRLFYTLAEFAIYPDIFSCRGVIE